MTREAKRLVLAVLVLIVALIVLWVVAGRRRVGFAPTQPIAFFHYVHARDKQIACEYCHRTVRSAANAGVPSTQFCMRCHRVVIPNFSEIQKLHGYWNRREAVPWVRVNRLPGFVNFDHHAHTVIGKLDCVPCHGDVKEMDVIRQTAPLNMGWCLSCHRGEMPLPAGVTGAPTNCVTCHR